MYIKSVPKFCFVWQIKNNNNNNNNLLKLLTNLEEWNLSGDKITDDCLKWVGKNLKNLKTLYLDVCGSVTDVGIYAIGSLPKLKSSTFYKMDEITEKCLNKMKVVTFIVPFRSCLLFILNSSN